MKAIQRAVSMQEPTLALEFFDSLDRELLNRDERALIRELSGELMLAPSGNFWEVPAPPAMSTPAPRKLNPPGVSVLEHVPARTPQPKPVQRKKLNQIGRTQVASLERARARSRGRSNASLSHNHTQFPSNSLGHTPALDCDQARFSHSQNPVGHTPRGLGWSHSNPGV